MRHPKYTNDSKSRLRQSQEKNGFCIIAKLFGKELSESTLSSKRSETPEVQCSMTTTLQIVWEISSFDSIAWIS
jgi:hypothetical protein